MRQIDYAESGQVVFAFAEKCKMVDLADRCRNDDLADKCRNDDLADNCDIIDLPDELPAEYQL